MGTDGLWMDAAQNTLKMPAWGMPSSPKWFVWDANNNYQLAQQKGGNSRVVMRACLRHEALLIRGQARINNKGRYLTS